MAATFRPVFAAMPPRHRSWLAAAVVAATLFAEPAFARTVFVNTRYAKVRSGTTSTSPEVAKVAHGQALEVVGEQGGFLQVRLPGGQTGWLARAWTGAEAPKKDGVLERLGQAARAGGKQDVSYTAGARGLSQEAEAYAERMGQTEAAAAVQRMESWRIADDELESFLRAGRLGEFRLIGTGAVAAGTEAP